MISAGALTYMHKLLKSSRNNIVKEAAWTISNITAGNPHQIAAVIEEGLFDDICEVLKGGEYRSQKEAAWVITNVTSSGTEQQISYLIGTVGILKPFCDLMTSQDPRCVLVILSGLKNLFALADKKGFLENFLTVRVNFTLKKYHSFYTQIIKFNFNDNFVFFFQFSVRYLNKSVASRNSNGYKSMKMKKFTNKSMSCLRLISLM